MSGPGIEIEGEAVDPIVGRTLGEFVVREKLGAGGFGAVYRALQPLLEREAVIKVLHARHRTDEGIIGRFMREARLASRLEHPYAAHVYAFGAEADGLLWIAMELVRGTPLDKLIADRGPVSLDRMVPLLEQIAEVVHAAHDHGVVHRDLKPANVMVLARGGRLMPKLLDFGIAKGLDASGPPPALPAQPFPSPAAGTPARRPSALEIGDTMAPVAIESMAVATRPARPSKQPPYVEAPDIGLQGTMPTRPARPSANPPFAATPARPQTITSTGAGAASMTMHGMAIGSPPYMAPEQWDDAAAVDARADIYALGALVYECLTGRHAFRGTTIAELEIAHKTAAVPALGGDLPAALDPVIAKAMAKRPVDRFASAVDFAVAFRDAAGLGLAMPLPGLDPQLRDALLADAPHPIAEAVAALGAARSVHQARDAFVDGVRAVVRYLGVLALACRTRIGPGDGDAPRTVELLTTLRRRRLTDREWLELARTLTAPFARRRDVYPVPELVAAFHDGDLEHAFAELLALDEAERHVAAEEHVREVLERALPVLATVLRPLAFLLEYTLVVARADGRGDRWMGTARTRRGVVALSGDVAAGRPVLVDSRGTPVLGLWPLVQVAAPTPGAPDDLFLIAGKGRHGARLVALPAGFERHDEHLWSWFRDELGVDEDADAAAAREQAPYRGLAAFTPADAGMFFGREREAEAFLNRLRVSPLLAVVGASGAGKSSFVQAGVVPDLPAGWRTLTVRPGATPIAALATQLAAWQVDTTDLHAVLARDPAALGERLRRAATGTLVLIVDQFEEVFTLCLDREERRTYAAAIALAARTADEPVRVILTMRDDFLLRAEQLPALRDRLGHGLELLAMPAPEDLRRILVEPARRHGYELEDADLADEMIAQIADQPGALPLLAFAAAKLWEVRDRHFHTLPRKAYEAMGGVGGALAQHAEATLASLPAEQLFLVREAFRHLVTSEGTRAVLSRDELAQLLGGADAAEAVIEKLVGSRLLVAQEGEGGREHIEVVHEALIGAWPRLVTWRQEDAEGARLRDQLRAAARQWEAKGRPRGHLWRDEQLTEYQLWRSRYRGRLTDVEESFAAAALADAARGRRVRRVVLVVAAVIGVVVIAVLVAMNDRAQSQRSRAEAANERAETALVAAQSRLIGLYEELGRQELLAGRQLRALTYLAAAYAGGGRGPALAAMLAQAARPVDAERARLAKHTDWVIGAVWLASPGSAGPRSTSVGSAESIDEKTLVTASKDGSLRFWRDAQVIDTLVAHPGGVLAIAANRRIATAGADGVKLWDGTRPIAGLAAGKVNALAWSADGARLAAAADDGNVLLLDAGGHGIGSFAHDRALAAIAIAGDRVASGGKAGKVWIDSIATQTTLATLDHGGEVLAVAFSPDGTLVATAGVDGRAVVWNTADGRKLATLAGHTLRVNALTWTADGTRVITSSKDATARIWDAREGRLVMVLAGHSEEVNAAWLAPDGETIVTASDDRTARTWDARTGAALMTFEGHTGGVMAAAFSRDGSQLVTTSYDKTARIWDARAGARRAVLRTAGEVDDAAFTPDDHVVAGGVGGAGVWTLDGARVARLGSSTAEVPRVAVAPDGSIVVGALDGSVQRWNGTATDHHEPFVAIRAVAAARDRFAFGGDSGVVRIIGADTTAAPHRAAITSLAFDPAGTRLAIASVDPVAAIHEPGIAVDLELVGHTDAISSIAWSPDGTRVATASADRSARIWDAATGTLLATLAGHTNRVVGVAWSPDGTRIATASWDRTAKLWDSKDGKLVASLEGHIDWVMQAAFTPDGGRVVTASHDKTAMVWDVAGGRLLATFAAHQDELNTVAISRDGTRAVTSSQDTTAMIWDIAPDRRSPAEIARLVACRVPYRLDGDKLIPIEPHCP